MLDQSASVVAKSEISVRAKSGESIPEGWAFDTHGNTTTDAKEALKGTDTEVIKKKTQNLVQVSMKLGEAVYKSQQKNQPKDNKNDKDPKNKDSDKENVVDADFEDVKEDKEKSA